MTKIIIFGGSGLVGSRFISLQKDHFEISSPSATEVNILNKDQILEYLNKSDGEYVINFAAYTQVEKAEEENDNTDGIVYKLNAIGPKNIANICKQLNKHLIHISTDYIFDGTKSESPYTEEDKPNPINWYGATKLFGEEFVLASGCRSCIVRISMPFSPFYEEKMDIARFFLQQLKKGNPVQAVKDQRITPTLVDDIANALRTLIANKAQGLFHVSSKDSVTPLEFAKTIANAFDLNYSLISPIGFDGYNKKKKAKVLRNSWLNPANFEKQFGDDILHTVEEGLIIFKTEINRH